MASASPEQIARFQFLFRGNHTAHYVRRPNGDPLTVYRGITAEDVARHLAGKQPSLLSVPTNAAGLSHFGLIDVDRHGDPTPVDWPELARQVASLSLPLVVCKSTGGKGAWLILILKEPEGFSSALVRQILADYAARLGVPNSEIFPKQDHTDRCGSPVNLPYFGIERPAFDRDGNELDINGFLNFAEQRAIWGALLVAPERVARVTKSANNYEPIGIWQAEEAFDRLLHRAAAARPGERHDLLHEATWYAARASLAGVFDKVSVKKRIWEVARAIFPATELPARRRALKRGWKAGRAAGPLNLVVYPEDLVALRHPLIADDLAFWRAFYGNIVDFPSAAEAKRYMQQKLEAVGAKHIARILKASDIDDAVFQEILSELELEQLLENSASRSSK